MSGFQDRLQAALGDAYRLERELTRGGMSRLFLATEASLNRQVVVKVLPPEFTSEVSAARFQQEIQVAAHLQHPNILPVLTAGAKDDLLYYVMPYVVGESLRHRLSREGKLPVAEAVRILHEVADALAYADGHGVIHRDIKPENILLEENHAVLTDFGVARALIEAQSGGRLTATGVAVGTPAYMAPEQAAGERDLDARADVYALAVVGYEMLAGIPPFEGPTAQAVLAAHLSTPPKSLREVRPEVPAALSGAIARALAKAPPDRFRSAAEFRDALGASVAGALEPRGRKAALLIGGLGAALVAVVAAVLLSRPRAAAVKVDPNVVAVFPFRVTGADPALGYLREGMVDLLAAKLTGEGGPRAVDPRAVLSAWHRAGGSAAGELAEDATLRTARSLGAGQLIDGGIVGTPIHITLTALLRAIPGGATGAQASVEGSPDSLAGLIDRLTAQLLARGAREAEQRLPSLTTTSLPALRAYLDGQVAYRRGRYVEAVRHFEEALRQDSTFALAGIGMTSAAGWTGLSAQYARGIALAWVARDRLSERDRTILLAIAGPHYPAPSSEVENLAAWERVVAAIPEAADSWYWFGDQYFHWGMVLGLEDARQRAASAFRRALALDSTFAGPLEHLVELAAADGDTATGRRLEAVAWAADSTGDLAKYLSWRVALATGDSATFSAVQAQMDRLKALGFFYNIAQYDGVAIEDAERAATLMRNRASTREERQGAARFQEVLALNRGRPAEALAATEALRGVESIPHLHLWIRIVDALYWEGDTAAAAEAARELAKSADAPLAKNVAERRDQYTDIYAVEQWRLWHGELGTAARAISELRASASPRDSLPTVAVNAVQAATLEAMLAVAQHRVDAPAGIERLDSIMRRGPPGFRPFHQEKNLVVARLLEAQGDLKGALAAVRRRLYFLGPAFYLSTYLREEGRLAALTGDREGAIRAYQHYLALRSDPEPAVKPEVDRVRAELAKLVGEKSR